MQCGECSGDLYQPESGDRRIPKAEVPAVCRRCGAVWVRGGLVNLPQKLRDSMVEMIPAVEKAAAEQYSAAHIDPDKKAVRWFKNVYIKGYQNGFFRALAYFKHHAKEGRLVRMRTLWSSFYAHEIEHSGEWVVTMGPDGYNEFCQLLNLHGARNAKSQENLDTARESGHAHVQRQAREEGSGSR